jgi:hypothetical protein
MPSLVDIFNVLNKIKIDLSLIIYYNTILLIMPICTICKTRLVKRMNAHAKEVDTALSVDDLEIPESRPSSPLGTPPPPQKRGRGRPRTVADHKEAKKKYNADHYQKMKAKKRGEEDCNLDSDTQP